MKVLTFTSTEKPEVVEYLQSVGREGVSWTTDPEMAIHFFDDKVPTTTVILQFPILEPLFEAPSPADRPTVSEINLRHSLVNWFRQYCLPEEIAALNNWVK